LGTKLLHNSEKELQDSHIGLFSITWIGSEQRLCFIYAKNDVWYG